MGYICDLKYCSTILSQSIETKNSSQQFISSAEQLQELGIFAGASLRQAGVLAAHCYLLLESGTRLLALQRAQHRWRSLPLVRESLHF